MKANDSKLYFLSSSGTRRYSASAHSADLETIQNVHNMIGLPDVAIVPESSSIFLSSERQVEEEESLEEPSL